MFGVTLLRELENGTVKRLCGTTNIYQYERDFVDKLWPRERYNNNNNNNNMGDFF